MLLFLVSGFFISCAKGTEVPEAVKNFFNQKFPSATNVKWEMENATVYEAEFKMNGEEMSANFKSDGAWLETESEIEKNAVSSVVTNAVKAKYPNAIIEEVEKVESAEKGILYELEIKEGKNENEIIVTGDGMSITAAQEKEDDKGDKED